jgi:hypothetical protein
MRHDVTSATTLLDEGMAGERHASQRLTGSWP